MENVEIQGSVEKCLQCFDRPLFSPHMKDDLFAPPFLIITDNCL